MSTDQADWTNSVTLYNQAGSPISPGGGTPQYTKHLFIGGPYTTAPQQIGVNLTDGLQHYVVSTTLCLTITACSGTSPGGFTTGWSDFGGHLINGIQVGVIPPLGTGGLPTANSCIFYSGGLPIPIRPAGSEQLSWVLSSWGGPLTPFSVEVSVEALVA